MACESIDFPWRYRGYVSSRDRVAGTWRHGARGCRQGPRYYMFMYYKLKAASQSHLLHSASTVSGAGIVVMFERAFVNLRDALSQRGAGDASASDVTDPTRLY
jgi:hypothetical protein